MSIEISKLPSGIRVVTDTVKSVETVSLGVWVGAGSRDENVQNNGVAHFLEHMAFKGTTTRTALQIAEEIESVGGYLNAYTSREVTAYYAKVLKKDTKRALDILGDILQNSTFDPQEMEREREVILQEIGQTHDTPDDIIFDYFQETAFPNQSLGRPILGLSPTVKTMERETLINFMKDHYDPQNIVLVASGHVDHQDFLAWVHDLDLDFSGKASSYETPQFQGGDFRQHRDLEQLHFLIGMDGPGAKDPLYYATNLFSTVFGGGMSSRLFQEVREKRGLVYSIYSFLTAYSDSGIFGIYAGTGGRDIDTLIQILKNEFEKMTHTITEEELDRSKAQVKAGLLMGLESTSSRARRIAHSLLTHNRYVGLEEVVEKIEATTTQDLHAVGETLIKTPTVMASLGPISSVPHITSF